MYTKRHSYLVPFRSCRNLLFKFWTLCVFEPPFFLGGGLTDNVRCSSWARWQARSGLKFLLVLIELFRWFYGWGATGDFIILTGMMSSRTVMAFKVWPWARSNSGLAWPAPWPLTCSAQTHSCLLATKSQWQTGYTVEICLPAEDVERMRDVLVAEPVVEVNNDVRPRLLREAAQRDAIAPRHERVGTVADLMVAAQHTDVCPACGWPRVGRWSDVSCRCLSARQRVC